MDKLPKEMFPVLPDKDHEYFEHFCAAITPLVERLKRAKIMKRLFYYHMAPLQEAHNRYFVMGTNPTIIHDENSSRIYMKYDDVFIYIELQEM